jgi:tetrahydromethanopterin S-methyltransferase subunit G|tara:strand:+ start:13139 stop:13372 length:234 start_codon:yes stop_codon:yes gene_type:complete
MTMKDDISLMEHRMNSMEEKLDKMDGKLDMLTEKLLDPDYGVTARVNRNTTHRKVMSKALWVIYAIVIGVVIKMIWN